MGKKISPSIRFSNSIGTILKSRGIADNALMKRVTKELIELPALSNDTLSALSAELIKKAKNEFEKISKDRVFKFPKPTEREKDLIFQLEACDELKTALIKKLLEGEAKLLGTELSLEACSKLKKQFGIFIPLPELPF